MAECTYCGGFVTDDYARVFGDNENRVDDCRNCPTRRTTPEDEEADGGQRVLLRDVEETTEERSESSDRAEPAADRAAVAGAADGANGKTTDGVADGANGKTADGVADGANGGADSRAETGRDEEGGGGRLQSGLDAMVSALRP